MVTSAEVLDALRNHLPFEQHQINEVERLVQAGEDPELLIRNLIDQSWLTAFQGEYLLTGSAADLVLDRTYLLLEKLGEGGMGQVFLARHRVMKRICAIKVIRPECLANEKAVQRFYREIELVASLDHPNIVRAYDANETSGTHYFVMEYVEGQDLSQVIRGPQRLTIRQAADVIRQAALGLQHAHEKEMVHRDIKPSNLILASKGEVVKILDLGLARALDSEDEEDPTPLTPTGHVMGTLDFMAPEQAKNVSGVDIRADIYSLGCTLYQILTGELPFPGGPPVTKLYRHLHEEPEPVARFCSDVPEEMLRVLKRMMAKSPEDRQQTPQEIANELIPFCRVLRGSGKSVTVPNAPSREEQSTASESVGQSDSSRLPAPSQHQQILSAETRSEEASVLTASPPPISGTDPVSDPPQLNEPGNLADQPGTKTPLVSNPRWDKKRKRLVVGIIMLLASFFGIVWWWMTDNSLMTLEGHKWYGRNRLSAMLPL